MVDSPAKADVMRLVLDFMQMEEFAKDRFVVSEAEGIRLKSTDGCEYIDGLAGVFTVSLGHGNRAIIDAVTEQLNKIAFAPPLHGTNPAAIDLAKVLTEFAPPGFGAVKFVSGGSEATEAAMKIARQYHVKPGNARKYKIIAKYGAYHGATMEALSAGGGWGRKSVFEPLLGHLLHVHPPYCYRCPYGQMSEETRGNICAEIVDKTIVAEILGHRSSAFTSSRYGHVISGQYREVADAMADVLTDPHPAAPERIKKTRERVETG